MGDCQPVHKYIYVLELEYRGLPTAAESVEPIVVSRASSLSARTPVHLMRTKNVLDDYGREQAEIWQSKGKLRPAYGAEAYGLEVGAGWRGRSVQLPLRVVVARASEIDDYHALARIEAVSGTRYLMRVGWKHA